MSGGTGVVSGGQMARARANEGNNQSDGLNPNRQRGFVTRRIETPTLNDMRARQGAVVSKFFYTGRPTWESLANFVYSDLYPSTELRSGVVDV